MKHVKPGQVVCMVVAVAVVLLTMAGEQAARATTVSIQTIHCGGWSIVPSPNATDYQNQLNAVAAVSASDVWAVGESAPLRGPFVTLVEHWDGSSWTIVPSPNPSSGEGELYGVAAVSATDVWAVGDVGGFGTGTLIEHWDGSQWQLISSPSVKGTFFGIAAHSATDIWAVGSQMNGDPLTEHWDGSAWHVVPAPRVPNYINTLDGVTVLSPTDAWAVGNYTINRRPIEPKTLIEHWDGQQWSIVPSPNVGTHGNALFAIAALSAQDVWTVGIHNVNSLNEHWDGSKWSVISPSLNGAASGVAAITSTDIWAVGASDHFIYDTFVEQWNGTQWQQVSSPNVEATTLGTSYDNYLNGVSASSAHNVWAVGYYATHSSDTTYTLIEHYC